VFLPPVFGRWLLLSSLVGVLGGLASHASRAISSPAAPALIAQRIGQTEHAASKIPEGLRLSDVAACRAADGTQKSPAPRLDDKK